MAGTVLACSAEELLGACQRLVSECQAAHEKELSEVRIADYRKEVSLFPFFPL